METVTLLLYFYTPTTFAKQRTNVCVYVYLNTLSFMYEKANENG